GDVLFIDLFTPDADIEALRDKYGLEAMPLTGAYFTDLSQEIGMAEVILPATSELVGKTVAGARFRDRYGVAVVGLRRGVVAHGRGLQNEELRVGDTLLVVGPWKAILNLQSDGRDLVVFNLPAELADVLPVPRKAPQAVFCLALVVILMVSGVVPNVQAALIGCLLMGALGVIDLDSAYRSIACKPIVLIVGKLPFSLSLQRTGGVQLVG